MMEFNEDMRERLLQASMTAHELGRQLSSEKMDLKRLRSLWQASEELTKELANMTIDGLIDISLDH